MKAVHELEADLRRMRKERVGYSLEPHHDPKELLRRMSACAHLWGAIECLKRGEMPVLPSQQALLE